MRFRKLKDKDHIIKGGPNFQVPLNIYKHLQERVSQKIQISHCRDSVQDTKSKTK